MHDSSNNNLRETVYHLMSLVPSNKVTTYGDLAAMAGHPGAARVVGGIAHQGPDNLPWHRLVNATGGLAGGFPGGRQLQQRLLEDDGIICDNEFRVADFPEKRWRP